LCGAPFSAPQNGEFSGLLLQPAEFIFLQDEDEVAIRYGYQIATDVKSIFREDGEGSLLPSCKSPDLFYRRDWDDPGALVGILEQINKETNFCKP